MALIINAKKRRIMKKIFFAIVSTLLVAGCAKENLVEPMGPQNGVTVLTAGIPTKTVLQNDQKVLWTNGDKINVNGIESNALELEEAATTAAFTIPGVLDNPYKAVFPASIYKDAQTVTLPAVQTYAENSFGATAAPMAAYAENGNNLKFQHLCAVLKLNISKGEDVHEIAYVEFSGKNNEKVCGDFTIDYQNATLTPAVGMTFTEKKVRCNVAKTIPDTENLVVYVVVPAIQYADGYTVRVVDAQGHYMEKSKASGQTLDAGTVYDMPEFPFVPTDTNIDADIKIKNATEFVDFVQKYNDGTHAADVSVALMNNIVFDETTSAAFNATGGIGAGSTFNGYFNGNNKSIKNLTATVSLFYKIAGTAFIKDLTLDETTSFTFKLSNFVLANGNRDAAAIVGATSTETNEVSNVVVKSDITVEAENLYDSSTLPYTLNLGGIVARCYYGEIRDCSFSGKITFPSTFAFGSGSTNSKYNGFQINVAGICGAVTNAKGAIYSSVFDGSIEFNTKITGYYQKVRVAGIVGYFGNDVRNPLNGANDKSIQNNGAITVDQANNAANKHYYYVAGIVAESLNNVSNTKNTGKIEAKVTGRNTSGVKLAGIVGKLSTEKTVSNCENTGEVFLNLSSNSSVVDAFLAETTYADGKTYDDVVLNCTNTGNVH